MSDRKLSKDEATKAAFALLGVIMQMSDDAQKLGGATSIAGVASLHRLQTSLQKNGPRMAAICKAYLEGAA